MEESVFSELAELALRTSGQLIPPGKIALAEARLMPILRREGFSNTAELLGCIKAREHSTLAQEAAARLSSRETWFFRDKPVLETVVMTVLASRAEKAPEGRLRVWCAGSAAGQEAYSLAMLMQESGLYDRAKVDLLATDFCADMVARVRGGVYSHFEIQRGLSVGRMMTHFKPASEGSWQAQRALRERIAVRQHNLLDDMEGLGQFDVILCRNVMPAMSPAVQADVASRLARQLRPGGQLVLGLDEHVPIISDTFEANRDTRGLWMTIADAEASAAA